MALVAKTTRDASGQPFTILFEDNGNTNGPLTPVSVITGTALTALQEIASYTEAVATEATLDAANTTLGQIVTALAGTLQVEFATAQQVTGTLGFVADENIPVVAATNLPVVDGTAALVFTTASGTSTGSAIALLTANANRRAFQFQNASDTDFTVNFDGTASASAGFLVAPGKLLEFYGPACPKGAVSIFCGAASKRYVCRVA